MKITGGTVGTDAMGATERSESKEFMYDLLAVCHKHGLALVPQDTSYDVSFLIPMRVVPLTPEIEHEIEGSWVVFERE